MPTIRFEPSECGPGCGDPGCPHMHGDSWFVGDVSFQTEKEAQEYLAEKIWPEWSPQDEKPWKCSHCTKRFVDAFAVRQHHKMKHRNKKLAQSVKEATQQDDDESFADRAIAAELDHAMGVDNPDYDWLVEPVAAKSSKP